MGAAITPTSNLEVAFKDVDVAVLVGGFPRKVGMERKDLIEKNVTIFKAQGEAIEKFASRNVKILVVANPANTNCLIAMQNAPSIPRKNFSAMVRSLDGCHGLESCVVKPLTLPVLIVMWYRPAWTTSVCARSWWRR